MSNLANLDVIRLYLRQQFPKHHIADFEEGTSRAHVSSVSMGRTAILSITLSLSSTFSTIRRPKTSNKLSCHLVWEIG